MQIEELDKKYLEAIHKCSEITNRKVATQDRLKEIENELSHVPSRFANPSVPSGGTMASNAHVQNLAPLRNDGSA